MQFHGRPPSSPYTLPGRQSSEIPQNWRRVPPADYRFGAGSLARMHIPGRLRRSQAKLYIFCSESTDVNRSMPLRQLIPTSTFQADEVSHRSLTENDLKILWISRTLTNIDAQCCEDILNIERSDLEIEQKKYIRDQLMRKYQERRAPYQALLESLKR